MASAVVDAIIGPAIFNTAQVLPHLVRGGLFGAGTGPNWVGRSGMLITSSMVRADRGTLNNSLSFTENQPSLVIADIDADMWHP